MWKAVEEMCAIPNQRFLCSGSGSATSRRFVASIQHALGPPATKRALKLLQSLTGEFSEQFDEFYRQHNGAALFSDPLSDAIGFFISPIGYWRRDTKEMRRYFEVLTEGEDTDPRLQWVRTAVAFAEVPYSGHYFALVLEGSNAGRIVYTDHEVSEREPYADDFNSFVRRIITNPAQELCELGCYTQFSDGTSDMQWVPERWLSGTDEP